MCDTIVSLKPNNLDKGVIYFAKNSDREPDEIQIVEFHPKESRNGRIKTTHIEVDFENETNAIVISRPYWMWGAEMGFNEHGVAIGNEAIFTKRKFNEKGLLGMDLLRLGLEIGKDSKSAIDTIIDYLEKYGQGGSNSNNKKEFYDNSFLIVDKKDAYVMEIYDKDYRIKKINNFGSISNIPSKIFKNEKNNVNYKPNELYSYFGKGKIRNKITLNLLNEKKNNLKIEDVMEMMRTHHIENFHPRVGSNADICMHSGHLTRRFQTANSMILEIYDKFIISWFTYSSNPCISLYKPYFFNLPPYEINYGKDYWAEIKRIHEELAFSNEKYSDAMYFTILNQKRINKIVDRVRNKMLINDFNFKIKNVYDEIQKIDAEHILALESMKNV